MTHLQEIPQDTFTGIKRGKEEHESKQSFSGQVNLPLLWGVPMVGGNGSTFEEIMLHMFNLMYYPLNQVYQLMNQIVPLMSQTDHLLNIFPSLIHSSAVFHLLKAGV